MRVKTFILPLLLFGLVFATSCKTKQAAAKGPRWEKLGERVVNFKGDRDEIPVTASDGTFTALKLKVRNAPIFIKNVRVIYGNGDAQNFPVGRKIAAGSETPAMDLPGNKRVIRKVVFNYRSAPNRGMDKAVMVLWGRH